jgi:hypothetical protein
MPKRSFGARLALAVVVLLALALVAHFGGGRIMHALGHLHGR